MSIVEEFLFFFNDTATTEIYTLSLHDALPILWGSQSLIHVPFLPYCFQPVMPGSTICFCPWVMVLRRWPICTDRKSTRLNSSHANISYAVFCLKKKKKTLYISNTTAL